MSSDGYLLGLDVGSSSVKASLLDCATGKPVAAATSPQQELEISAPQPGWAEQDPELWWEHVARATRMLNECPDIDLSAVRAIGISYQMHGLVLLDSDNRVLRPAIIWCDSRTVETGRELLERIGEEVCRERLLNYPGNFTASKLKWVKDNEPDTYARAFKFVLPGDYVAMRMTGEVLTTRSGLSEGILWDFLEDRPADLLLEACGFDKALLPELCETFGEQGRLTAQAAGELGVPAGTPVTYRAGDQPNNAFALNALEPGELAATAGTSGVVCGVVDQPVSDVRSRVNTFVHVNHSAESRRYAVLLCLNGCGILNSWLKRILGAGSGADIDYPEMNRLAAEVPPGSDGLLFFPYGNGAERPLENRAPGAALRGLQLTRHGRGHLLRSAQEGIAFALNYGLRIMREMGLRIDTIRAGHANMFLSPVFGEAFAAVSGATVEIFDTDGAQGAARGAGIGAGLFSDFTEAFSGLSAIKRIEPEPAVAREYAPAYAAWQEQLCAILEGET